FSRSFLAGLCREGRVLVAGARARPSRRLMPDEEITVVLPEPVRAGPEEMDIELVHEDSAVFVVNKPAGIAVHPARGHLSGTLYHGLLWRYRRELESDPDFRIGPVHRLDLDTSGVMIYAKDERTQKRLARAMEKRDVRKRYLAVVHGEVPYERVVLDGAIGTDEPRKRMAVDGVDSRPARTGLVRTAVGGGFSLLELELFTGRSHQLRVHLAAAGHPLVGDELYGGRRRAESGEPLIGRQALHAWKLELEHPVTTERVEYVAPLPDDISALIRRAGMEPPP
ncbi:MAG: RluA family pseudouridine synthase, partial [Planctomycetota bacterium]